MILLILYSSFILISSSRGCGKLGPYSKVSLYEDRREVWNMSWIFHCFDSFSWKAREGTTWMIWKGPVHFDESFLEGTWSLRFLILSQTLSPTFQGLKHKKVCFFMCCCVNL